jgi:hypothetical protein
MAGWSRVKIRRFGKDVGAGHVEKDPGRLAAMHCRTLSGLTKRRTDWQKTI